MLIEAAIWESVRVLVLFVLPLTALVGIVSLAASTVAVVIGVRDPIVSYIMRLLAVVGAALLGGGIVLQALFDFTLDVFR